ncbi:MAG: signal peptidase [Aeromicrobium sp.]|nr:signal peptidase [Aeromicrobium sp.]
MGDRVVARPIRWSGQVAAWIVLLSMTAAIAAAVLVPRIGGATPYTILTGSMRPNMPPGTLVVIKPVPIDQIGIGTVVTYQLTSGEPTVVTHRVVAIRYDGTGKRLFTTQGDANNAPDAKLVRPVQIKGARWYYVPYLGYVNSFVTGKERQITMIAVVSGLLLYAAYMFTSDVRARFTRRSHRASS